MNKRKPSCKKLSVIRQMGKSFWISVMWSEISRTMTLRKIINTMRLSSWRMRRMRMKMKNSMLKRRLQRRNSKSNHKIRLRSVILKDNKHRTKMKTKFLHQKSMHIGFKLNSPNIMTPHKYSQYKNKSWKSCQKKLNFKFKMDYCPC